MLFLYCFCHDNQFCRIICLRLLDDSGNTYLMHSKYTRDCCKHTRFIIHQHTDIEFILYFFKILYRCVTITGAADSSRTMILNITDHIDHITHDRAGCRKFSRSTSIEHRIICCIGMYEYCIKGISDRCKRMLLRNHHRMYCNFYTTFCIMCDTEQFYHVTEFFCVLYVFCRNLRNSFCIYIIKCHSGMECDRCHDRYFTSGIQSFDIGCRVCLSIAKLGSKCQCIAKIHAFFDHLGQDKVRCTIDNTDDFLDLICRQTLLQWTDDRDCSCYGCLK